MSRDCSRGDQLAGDFATRDIIARPYVSAHKQLLQKLEMGKATRNYFALVIAAGKKTLTCFQNHFNSCGR